MIIEEEFACGFFLLHIDKIKKPKTVNNEQLKKKNFSLSNCFVFFDDDLYNWLF